MNQNRINQIIRETIEKVVNDKKNFNMLNEYMPNVGNHAPMVSINESNAKSLINRHSDCGYIILSPCRGGEDFNIDTTTQQGRDKLNQINRERFVELINILKQQPFSYTPIYGGFIEETGEEVKERSVIIYNKNRKGEQTDINELIQFGLEMANKFNQWSILVKEPNKNPKYLLKDGSLDFELGNNLVFNDLTQKYFTDLHKNSQKHNIKDRKPTRFTFTECYINPSPQCYGERYSRDYHNEIYLSR